MVELKDPPLAGDTSGIAAGEDGKLLWESLKSIGGVSSFYQALETLDAPELRKVILAARTESVKAAFGCRWPR
jgi:hypothetical protein